MRQRIIFSAAALAMSTTMAARAQNMDLNPSALTGPYVGVYGGYDWTDVDTANNEFQLDDWEGGIYAGYKLDHFLGEGMGIGANAAIEVFYGAGSGDDAINGVTAEKGQEWGVSLRPGISFLENATADLGWNPYGIIGYRRTDFQVSGPGVATSSEELDGIELGLGTELVAYGDVGVRLEYSHTWYDGEDGLDPDSDAIRLGASYHF